MVTKVSTALALTAQFLTTQANNLGNFESNLLSGLSHEDEDLNLDEFGEWKH